MVYLYWKFDWNAKKAEAESEEGNYVIEGDDEAKWTARFKKGTGKTDVLTRDPDKHTLKFETLSDALRACQRHCDRRSSETSGRLTIRTPLPSDPSPGPSRNGHVRPLSGDALPDARGD